MYVVYNLCDSYHCISICLCRFEWWCPQMSEKECRAHLHIHGPFLSSSFCVLHTHIDTQTMLEQYEVSRAWWDFFVHRIHGRMLEKTFIKGFNTSRVFSWRIFFWTQTQVTSMHAYSIYTFFFILSHVVFAFITSTPTNKVLVNNQTHPSIYPSFLSWKPFQTKANVTTETSGFHSVPWGNSLSFLNMCWCRYRCTYWLSEWY